jgi:DNA damage-binding protein 1
LVVWLQAYGKVDDNGSRYLLGDVFGRLHLLVLSHDNDRILGLKLQTLGTTSVASTISYLDNAAVFIGSPGGDSQLIR